MKCLALIFSLIIIIIQFLQNYIINVTISKVEFGISDSKPSYLVCVSSAVMTAAFKLT